MDVHVAFGIIHLLFLWSFSFPQENLKILGYFKHWLYNCLLLLKICLRRHVTKKTISESTEMFEMKGKYPRWLI